MHVITAFRKTNFEFLFEIQTCAIAAGLAFGGALALQNKIKSTELNINDIFEAKERERCTENTIGWKEKEKGVEGYEGALGMQIGSGEAAR